MSLGAVIRLTYLGGWAAVVLALAYKFTITVGWVAGTAARSTGVLPRHFWELGFLLFVICIATDVVARRQSA